MDHIQIRDLIITSAGVPLPPSVIEVAGRVEVSLGGCGQTSPRPRVSNRS
ncbi:hypothetical protein Rhow_004931 [Rhodococcus wratislaviensis]|uniref:Uncharacterized protein n=1 Tax=Rhodococcus wratislaviensis TaxID=44752 RepID=A0A402CCC1_RHOWR|nr:hypothetical protein Rhow_004931 [Rhodococcus wratislaviensis]